MGRITFSADPMHEDIVADVQAEDGVESQSAAVRECIERYADLQQRDEDLQQALSTRDERIEELRETVADLEDDLAAVREERDALEVQADRVEELETEVERLHRERRQLLEERDEKKELARYVEDERTAQERWRQAGIVTKTKWKLLGMPENGQQTAADSE